MAGAFAGAVRGRRIVSATLKDALHVLIIQPVGPSGRGRSASNPDLLELVWRP
jgi:hypothetical protein